MKRSPTLLIACLMLALLAATITVLPVKAEETTTLKPDSTTKEITTAQVTTEAVTTDTRTTAVVTTAEVTTAAVTTAPEKDADDGSFNWAGLLIALAIAAALIILICALIPKRRPK